MKVYLSLLELNTQYEIIDNVAPVHHVDFGTTAEVKLYEFDGEMYLLAVNHYIYINRYTQMDCVSLQFY